MAHARRKFVELHAANKSSIAGTALELFGQLYEVERGIHALAVATQRLNHRRLHRGRFLRQRHRCDRHARLQALPEDRRLEIGAVPAPTSTAHQYRPHMCSRVRLSSRGYMFTTKAPSKNQPVFPGRIR